MNGLSWLLFFILLSFIADTVWAKSVYVRGYHKKNGTYVSPHYRGWPIHNKFKSGSTVYIPKNEGGYTPNTNSIYIKGYYKKNGTYVSPHYRTVPSNSNSNSGSTPQNKGYIPTNTHSYVPVSNGVVIYKWTDKKGVIHFSDIPYGRN